jgi:hypothetical protein
MEQSTPFKDARIERHGRRHAEAMIEAAFLVFDARQPTDAELSDLADALDALRTAQFRAAIVLAGAAIEGRSKPRKAARAPMMARNLADLKAMAIEMARDGAAGHHQDF